MRVRPATLTDAGELLTLQLATLAGDAPTSVDPLVPPLQEGVAGVERVVSDPSRTVLTAEATAAGPYGRSGRLVGAAQLRLGAAATPDVGQVGQVVVAPDVQGLGLGSLLLRALHGAAAHAQGVRRLELCTSADSERNLEFYRKHGYVDAAVRTDERGARLQLMRRPV